MVEEVVKWVAFDAILGRRVAFEQFGERVDVARADVSLIGARMDGDAMRAGVERLSGEPNQARDLGPPGVSQRRDLVDVYGQPRHARSCSNRKWARTLLCKTQGLEATSAHSGSCALRPRDGHG